MRERAAPLADRLALRLSNSEALQNVHSRTAKTSKSVLLAVQPRTRAGEELNN